MKKTIIKKYAACAALAATLALLPASCIKDDAAPGTKETTLTLTFSTRAPGDTGSTTGPESANEHMRTLRVILAEQNGTIRYNTKIDDIPEDATDQRVTFSDLITVEDRTTTFDVYAIANEEAFVTSPNQLAATSGNISDMNLETLTLNQEVLAKLNQGLLEANQDNQAYRLPQTKKEPMTVIPGQDNEATIQLEFVVAKVDLTFTNEATQAVDLNNVTFSPMNQASTPLLPSVALATGGSDLNLGTVTVPASGSKQVTCYVYENQLAGQSNYMLRTDWGNNELNLSYQNGAEILGTQFARGTKLDIDITLNGTQMTDFELLVVPWSEKEITVPPFE